MKLKIIFKSYKERYFKYDKKYILYVGSIYFENRKNLLTSNLNMMKILKYILFISFWCASKIIEDNKLIIVLNRMVDLAEKSMQFKKLYDYLLMFDSTTDLGLYLLSFIIYSTSNPILCLGDKNSKLNK